MTIANKRLGVVIRLVFLIFLHRSIICVVMNKRKCLNCKGNFSDSVPCLWRWHKEPASLAISRIDDSVMVAWLVLIEGVGAQVVWKQVGSTQITQVLNTTCSPAHHQSTSQNQQLSPGTCLTSYLCKSASLFPSLH